MPLCPLPFPSTIHCQIGLLSTLYLLCQVCCRPCTYMYGLAAITSLGKKCTMCSMFLQSRLKMHLAFGGCDLGGACINPQQKLLASFHNIHIKGKSILKWCGLGEHTSLVYDSCFRCWSCCLTVFALEILKGFWWLYSQRKHWLWERYTSSGACYRLSTYRLVKL